MNSNSKIRVAKLAAYGAMGVGSLTFGATAANADICFTDLTGNEMIFSSASPDFDLDGDGNADFTFGFENFVSTTASGSVTSNFNVNFGGLGGNGVAATQYGLASALANRASISNRAFESRAYLQQLYSTGALSGYFPDGATGIVGVQFTDANGATQFGWVELTVTGTVDDNDFSDISIAISRFAFSKNGQPIVAGQTSAVPEPTAIGLLALGGIGVLARRRRHSAAC